MTKRKSSNKPKSKAPKSSGQAPSEARRSRTRERRAEREKQKRRNQQVLIVGGLIVAAIVVAVMFIVANQPAEAPVPEELIARYEGIPQTETDEGFYRLGRPDAPVRVEEFSSFTCPACEVFFDTTMNTIIDLVRDGAISFTFIPQETGSLQNPEGAARAALCAGEQDRFFEFHDMLFDWHSRFGNTAFSQNRLRSGADNLGLDTGEFNSCLTGGESERVWNSALSLANTRGVPGTPSTYVNGSPVESTAVAIEQAVQEALAFTGAQPIPLDIPDTDEDGMNEVETTPEVTEDAAAVDDETTETTPEATEDAAAVEDDTDESDTGDEPEETPESTPETEDE